MVCSLYTIQCIVCIAGRRCDSMAAGRDGLLIAFFASSSLPSLSQVITLTCHRPSLAESITLKSHYSQSHHSQSYHSSQAITLTSHKWENGGNRFWDELHKWSESWKLVHLLRECFEIENTPVVVDSHGDDASDGDDVYVVLNIRNYQL